MAGFIVVLLLGIVSAQAAPPAAGQPAGTSACLVSDDETYGYTPDNPIQIGGGAMYVKARETRYLNALRGPQGQPVTYERRGSSPKSADDLTIIDAYEVTYEGLDAPVRLYLDAYHYWEQRAPKGFTCGQPIQLQPMLDAFRASEDMRALAVEQGRTHSFAPIPLDPGGGTDRGVILDAFRILALDAASAAKGGTADAGAGRHVGTIVVVHPFSCGERTATPKTVDIMPAQGSPVPRTGEMLTSETLERLAPGLEAPAGSLAAAFPIEHPRRGDRVRIVYDGPACEGAAVVLIPIALTPARGVVMPEGALPEGADAAQARLLMQAVIDTDGAFTHAAYVGGPAHLKAPAMEVLKSWRAEPARVNGAPIPTSTLLEVRFK